MTPQGDPRLDRGGLTLPGGGAVLGKRVDKRRLPLQPSSNGPDQAKSSAQQRDGFGTPGGDVRAVSMGMGPCGEYP